MMTFLLWLLLLIFCWPLALLALVLWPLVWLIALPFRLLGIAVDGVFDLLRAILTLPGTTAISSLQQHQNGHPALTFHNSRFEQNIVEPLRTCH